MEVTIDEARFHDRLSRLRDHWQRDCTAAEEASSALWGGASAALCIPMGAASDGDALYSKSAALHLYLFGYEFPDSIILITKTSFLFMAAPKKCGYLQHLVAAAPAQQHLKVSLFHKTKDEVSNRQSFQEMLNVVKAAIPGKQKPSLGGLPKAAAEGDFVPAWTSFLASSGVETVDVNPGLSSFFALKDDVEIVSDEIAIATPA
jgi:nucleosome binding factor SPN SPT16 subunit